MTETPLHRLLLGLIAERGPLPFPIYQDLALYHPEVGYYSAGPERSGRGGDFLTSPELDPAFGALWARAFEQVWRAAGEPDDFTVVEVGPGEGGFAQAVLDAVQGEFAETLTYRLVERLPALTERQIAGLSAYGCTVWSASVEELEPGEAGVVFANEVLDNLPVHVIEGTSSEPVELYVSAHGESLTFEGGPVSDPRILETLECDSISLAAGTRYEVGLEAKQFAAASARAVGSGAVLLVDYGAAAGELAQRANGTLAAYSSGLADDRVLSRPGERDITSHANWTVVAAALSAEGCSVHGPLRQREVLRNLGIDDLHEELRSSHHEALRAGNGAAAVRALSRRQALGALADPGGLGGLQVVAGLRDVSSLNFLR